jgi:four helix bundle protein
LPIVRGTNSQLGGDEESHQAVGPDCYSSGPDIAAVSGRSHYWTPTLRSATSVAANHRTVCRARSTADFTSKLGWVLEVADETLFWLELLADAGMARRDQFRLPLDEANQLVSIFVASLRTIKGVNSAI